ncbi:unnamed protein product [Paramecium primaurelia]|uniref:Uncharacterized protein n=1 Tax=Paramecium primaurelia TaxID=5886 RepID=A0A8S1QQ93_PARPR|nr:unnamed protein product [Paramecium primaurelia]
MKDLLISSNQNIKTLKIFNIHQSKYKPFIKDINKIITKDKQEIVDKQVSQIQIFDILTNSFDFALLSFSLDPYKQVYNYLQIDISCQLKESNNTLKYRIYTKNLKCQLGEFFVNNGCQICQSNQVYYSVTYMFYI